MDTQTEQWVKEVVDMLVNRDLMFTAYDVTRIMRDKEPTLKHYEIKAIVHQMFEDMQIGGYTRTTVDVGQSVPPFLYYNPITHDPDTYDVDWILFDGLVSQSVQTPSAVTVDDEDDEEDQTGPHQFVKLLTAEGRLHVSPLLTRKIGLDPGDKVNLLTSTNPKFLAIYNELSDISHLTYQGGHSQVVINADGRVRISDAVLRNIGNVSEPFTVEVPENESFIQIFQQTGTSTD